MTQASPPTLEQIPANRGLVDALYAHGKISREAKDYALAVLHPADRWGVWASRLLLTIGSALILCGIVYFFAFNWAKIPPLVKLASLQAGLIACLIGAYFYSLNRVIGQLFLLSASLLTGVFMAVFGQIYQTGADAYELFIMWSLLIFGWTLISNFAAQWIFWLTVTNIFLILGWMQGLVPDIDLGPLIFILLAALNGTVLGLREYFTARPNKAWLQAQWIRVLLILATLAPMLLPVLILIHEPDGATTLVTSIAIFGCLGHGLLFALYRYKLKDMWSMAVITLSICIIVEAAGLKALSELFYDIDYFMFLAMGLMTLGIFTAAVMFLRKTMELIEVDPA